MRCIAIGVVVCGRGCVAGGTRCALSNEQHLMGLTFNQFTYSLSPTCLQKQHTGEAGNRVHSYYVRECPSRGSSAADLLHSEITPRRWQEFQK